MTYHYRIERFPYSYSEGRIVKVFQKTRWGNQPVEIYIGTIDTFGYIRGMAFANCSTSGIKIHPSQEAAEIALSKHLLLRAAGVGCAPNPESDQ